MCPVDSTAPGHTSNPGPMYLNEQPMNNGLVNMPAECALEADMHTTNR